MGWLHQPGIMGLLGVEAPPTVVCSCMCWRVHIESGMLGVAEKGVGQDRSLHVQGCVGGGGQHVGPEPHQVRPCTMCSHEAKWRLVCQALLLVEQLENFGQHVCLGPLGHYGSCLLDLLDVDRRPPVRVRLPGIAPTWLDAPS